MIYKHLNFYFVKVNVDNKEHLKLLYKILKKRKYNISNKQIPEYDKHVDFVRNINYRKWFLIFKENNIFGTYYITKNNYISINLLSPKSNDYLEVIKFILSKFKPLKEIKSIRNKDFLVNTNPRNIGLIKALKDLNFEHIENSYLCNVKLK